MIMKTTNCSKFPILPTNLGKKIFYKMITLIISDIHLGREDSNCKECLQMIKDNPTDEIILNGDILDQFALWKDNGRLYKKEHSKIVKDFRKLMKERKTKVRYTIGNHDYLMFLLVPFGFLFNMKIRKRIRKKELIIEHGDWITFYLWLRRIKRSDDFHENCITLAKKKIKKLIVGHSHEPEKLKSNDWVYDDGDWVKNNTYLIVKDGKII